MKNPFKKRNKSQIVYMSNDDFCDMIYCEGYTSLDKNPEIMRACRLIADLISSMTIYLMANTENGDQRIKNELSAKIDIYPSRHMTRKTWMDAIVMNLLLYGKGNSIVHPITKNGLIDDLKVIPASYVSFIDDLNGNYKISIQGKMHNPENILHFVLNPDKNYPYKGKGITCNAKDIAGNLKQAQKTEKSFMASKWKPSMIIKVDALTEEFSSPEGRERLLEEYISSNEAGKPWMIPADQFQIEQIKPLSLSDLAINDTVKIDKQAIASIMGVPAFCLGVGTYNKDEWNNFISSTIHPIALGIQQELTKKLLVSPKLYWQFNIASLYSYDLKTMADVYSNLYVRGIVTGNEVRDKVSMSPKEGLDVLNILENYIPLDKIGDQQKLKHGGEDNE